MTTGRCADGAGAIACPLCGCATTRPLLRADGRDYRACPHCAARFLHPGQRPDRAEEYRHYCLHENGVDDPGYRRFLDRLAAPLRARLTAPARGLDYGCGPGPALAAMLREAGHEVALFDPLFRPGHLVLATEYDFVTCTEVAEHFHDPAGEFARLRRLVRPGGWLALMTCFQTDDARFAAWHYRRDPTHVIFYRAETFRRLASWWRWHVEIPRKDVVLMRRPPPEVVR